MEILCIGDRTLNVRDLYGSAVLDIDKKHVHMCCVLLVQKW